MEVEVKILTMLDDSRLGQGGRGSSEGGPMTLDGEALSSLELNEGCVLRRCRQGSRDIAPSQAKSLPPRALNPPPPPDNGIVNFSDD